MKRMRFNCIISKKRKPNLEKEISNILKDYPDAFNFQVKGKGKVCFIFSEKSKKLLEREGKEIKIKR